MITREEKNKKVIQELNHEKTIKFSKTMLKITFIVAILFVGLYLYMRFIGTSDIKTNEFIVKNSNIPTSFHGTKIVHLSDILYGSTINKDDLNYLEKEIILLKPDIIIFTGDLINKNYDINQEEINYLKDFFQNIDAKLGKFAVKGELDNSTFDLIMNDTDFEVLDNNYKLIYNGENESITINGLNINNINNISTNNNNYTITLIHNFDYYDKYSIDSNLVLAGHNLNGEIYLPYVKGLLGNNKYNESYYEINNTIIHISNGLGSTHKMRLFNHPSINVYRLYNN